MSTFSLEGLGYIASNDPNGSDSCSGQGAVMAPMAIMAIMTVMAVMAIIAIMAVMVVMANGFLDNSDLSERPVVLT